MFKKNHSVIISIFIIVNLLIACQTNENFIKTDSIPAEFRVCDYKSIQQRSRMEMSLNKWRTSRGRNTFIFDQDLNKEALNFSQYLAHKREITHTDEYGNGPLLRLKKRGLNRSHVGQTLNISSATDDPVMHSIQVWAKKQQESGIILTESYYRAGFAFTKNESDSKCYVVLLISD